jgi:hypothetical protein
MDRKPRSFLALCLVPIFALAAITSVTAQTEAAKPTKTVTLWGDKVGNTHFQVGDANAPCGTRVNGAIVPPGYASCADNFCVDLPKDAGKVIQIILMAKDDQNPNGKKCDTTPNTDCDIGWSRFWSSPEVHPDKICGHYKNRSDNRDRWPGFQVTYEVK